MKRLTMLFFVPVLIVFLSVNLFSQTYGIFAEKEIYNLDGNLFDCDTCGAVIMKENGWEKWWKTGSDSSYFGDEGMHIIFDGFDGSDRVRFTIDSAATTTDDTYRTLDFGEWNSGDVAFYIKLLDTVNVHFSVRSFRNGNEPGDESDEPLTNWGLNTQNTMTWQKIYVDPTNLEGNYHDLSGFSQWAFRSRGYASDFLVDEIYTVYNLNNYSFYADSSYFSNDGSFGGEPRTNEGATMETVDDGYFGEGLHVTFNGGDDDRVFFGDTSTVSHPEWNSPLANLVFYIKLNEPVDVSVEYSALRNGEEISASDEELSKHGLDVSNTEDWQRIVLDLKEGMEGDDFDFDQFGSFRLRSRGNASDFIVDEMYVRYPAEEVAVDDNNAANSVPSSFTLEQNYPNPFNPVTHIEFSLTKQAKTTLTVYNVLGQKVAELVNGKLNAGRHKVNFNAGDLSSGTYFYKLTANNKTQIKKMLLLK